MKLALTALGLVLAVRTANAGPCVQMGSCASRQAASPDDGATLPIGPTITIIVHDASYAGTIARNTAKPFPVKATINGKRVPIAIKDVRTSTGISRSVRILSQRTGQLDIWTRRWRGSTEAEVIATYTVAKSAR